MGAGKTRLSQKVVDRLKNSHYQPGGVLSPRLMESGLTVGYDVINIATGNRRSFVRSHPPGKNVGRFFIKPGAIEFANQAISDAIGQFDPVFVDEVGRLELSSDGLAPSVEELLSSQSQAIILVRDEFISDLREVFGIREYDDVRVEGSSG
ncbi:hypothetical protein KGY77_02150 [Candidatus Bipolaricaulota bacterium]|nr:hypothetical protein [Candidatus Bipolaricaulota bacterium]